MKAASAVALTLCLLLSAPLAQANPVQKVIQLLSDLEAKINKEGSAAAKIHEDYVAMCKERSSDLQYEIKTGKAEVADLTAAVNHASGAIEGHNAEIDDATSTIATNEADLKAATEVRAKETADFEAEEKNLVEVISALERAVVILEREARKGGAAMVQVQRASNVAQALSIMVEASMIGSQDAQTLTALVQGSEQDNGAPDAAVYESHSGSIIETLQSLLEKARSQLDDARHKETSTTHNFEMLKESLDDSIKFAGNDLATAKGNLATQAGAKSVAAQDRAETSNILAENKKAAAALARDCSSEAHNFEAATKSRSEELAALAEARKVISDMTGGAKSITYSASFLQAVRSSLKTGADLANFEVVRFVRKLAERQHSDALAQLGRRLASTIEAGNTAGEDPFAKVKGLISELISRLEGEASADAKHKAYCDKELAYTNDKKQRKDATAAKLNSEIDTMTARSAMLKDQVAALQAALAALAKTQADMNNLRQEQHAQFLEDKAEMEKGIEGIKYALKVLREYYAQQGAHDKASDTAGGIVGLIEVIESDFTKTLAETVATEQQAQSEYEQQTKANDVDRVMKEQDVKYKTQEVGQLTKGLTEAGADRESVNAELAAINQYKAELIEMCVPKAETYAARKAKRDAEIAGLQEALNILESEAALLQRGRHGLRGRAHRA